MNPNQPDGEFQAEYAQIRSDVRAVLISNALFLALLVALYFADQKFGFLGNIERLF